MLVQSQFGRDPPLGRPVPGSVLPAPLLLATPTLGATASRSLDADGRRQSRRRLNSAITCEFSPITPRSSVRIRPPPLVFSVAKLGYRRVIRQATAQRRWLLSFLGQGPQGVATRPVDWKSLSATVALRPPRRIGQPRDRHSRPKSRLSLSLTYGWVNSCWPHSGLDPGHRFASGSDLALTTDGRVTSSLTRKSVCDP